MTDTSWSDEQGAANNDPINQPHDVDKIEQTAPGNTVGLHPVIEHESTNKSSGKQIDKVDAPVISINPTSNSSKTESKKPNEYKIFDKANQHLNQPLLAATDFAYPFADLDIGQGFFVPVQPNQTTDKLMDNVHDQVNMYREQNSECEKDKEGNDVWESVVIQTKKRTQDGIIQLDGAGKPIVGANQTNRPKLIYAANFIVRPVVKGDEMAHKGHKADSDGVMVIRVL